MTFLKEKKIKVDNLIYERILIKTHLITFGEDLISLIKKYVSEKYQKGDWVAISE